MNRPVLPQFLCAGQNFLDDHVNRASVFRQWQAEHADRTVLERFEIFSWQIQAVGMIDPQSGHCSCSDKIEKQQVRSLEYFRQFHPNSGQIVHIEEAPVVDLLSRDAPESETIRLRVE